MTHPIVIERQGRVVIVTVNRPEARNALNSEVMHAMADELAPLLRERALGRLA